MHVGTPNEGVVLIRAERGVNGRKRTTQLFFCFPGGGNFLLSASAALLTSLFVFLVYNNITTILQADIYRRQDREGGRGEQLEICKKPRGKTKRILFCFSILGIAKIDRSVKRE